MLQEDTNLELMKKFDVVMNYHIQLYTSGVHIPIFMDMETWDKARREATEIARRGLLDEFYERIMKNAI